MCSTSPFELSKMRRRIVECSSPFWREKFFFLPTLFLNVVNFFYQALFNGLDVGTYLRLFELFYCVYQTLKSKSRNRPLLCQMRTAKRQKSLDAASPFFLKSISQKFCSCWYQKGILLLLLQLLLLQCLFSIHCFDFL